MKPLLTKAHSQVTTMTFTGAPADAPQLGSFQLQDPALLPSKAHLCALLWRVHLVSKCGIVYNGQL